MICNLFSLILGHCHAFPYQGDVTLRSHDSVIENARKVTNERAKGNSMVHEKGIKGPTWLMLLPGLDMVDGICIDYMHSVLGVQKLLLRLWFSSEFQKEAFSYYSKVDLVNSRLRSMRPPLDITRMPEDVSYLKHWKASVYKVFLLQLGLPSLHGVLKDDHFKHFQKLVYSVYTLLKSDITPEEIKQARTNLDEFVADFEKLYAKRFLTLNVHRCLHLADQVEAGGPLFCYSCFPFEDKNGYILKMIQGARHVDSQVVSAISMVQKLPLLAREFILPGTPESELFNTMKSKHYFHKKVEITRDIFVMGAIQSKVMSTIDSDYNTLASELEVIDKSPICFRKFNRIYYKGMCIYGTDYKRMIKRDNSIIKFKSETGHSFARVKYFLQYSITETQLSSPDNRNLAVVELLINKTDESSLIVAVNDSKKIKAIDICDIESQCMFAECHNGSFVMQFPNTVESE